MSQAQTLKAAVIADGISKYLDKTESSDLLPQVIENLGQKIADKKQAVVVETAVELDESEKAQIEKIVGKCSYKVSPDLIGGLRVTRGDKVLDLSINARLQKIYEQI